MRSSREAKWKPLCGATSRACLPITPEMSYSITRVVMHRQGRKIDALLGPGGSFTRTLHDILASDSQAVQPLSVKASWNAAVFMHVRDGNINEIWLPIVLSMRSSYSRPQKAYGLIQTVLPHRPLIAAICWVYSLHGWLNIRCLRFIIYRKPII